MFLLRANAFEFDGVPMFIVGSSDLVDQFHLQCWVWRLLQEALVTSVLRII